VNANQIITELDKFQAQLFVRRDGAVVPSDPVTLANNLLRIRGLLIALVDHVADADLDYRKTKAARFDKLIKEGVKRSPAMDQLDMEEDLIDKKITAERLRNYAKYVDGLCTSIQSVLKVQSTSEKNQY
jgi:hypothetical protein